MHEICFVQSDLLKLRPIMELHLTMRWKTKPFNKWLTISRALVHMLHQYCHGSTVHPCLKYLRHKWICSHPSLSLFVSIEVLIHLQYNGSSKTFLSLILSFCIILLNPKWFNSSFLINQMQPVYHMKNLKALNELLSSSKFYRQVFKYDSRFNRTFKITNNFGVKILWKKLVIRRLIITLKVTCSFIYDA